MSGRFGEVQGGTHAPKHSLYRNAVALMLMVAVLLVTGGNVLADGNEAPGNPGPFRELTVGGTHACAILADGHAKCWGGNERGQLGLGDTADRGDGPGEMGDNLHAVELGTGKTAVAIAAGHLQTCALLDNGALKCWGYNGYGTLGLGDTVSRGDDPAEMGDNLPSVDLGTGRTVVAVSLGAAHACALLDDGTVKCWGHNGWGQLGLGDYNPRGDEPGEMGDNLPAIALGTARTAVAIAAGGSHTCALLDDASVKCWGDNDYGKLGLGDTADRGGVAGEMGDNLTAVDLGTGRSAVAIAAGYHYTCALLDNAKVKCWGHGYYAQLGLGDDTNRGDGPGEMGDDLPVVDLGTATSASAITTGGSHTCALLNSGHVKCWGNDSHGGPGLGESGNRGDHPSEMGDGLPAVDLGAGRTSVAVAAGDSYTCVRLDNASVKCWGYNSHGQLGLGDTVNRGDDPGEMGDNLPGVDLGTQAALPTWLLAAKVSNSNTLQPKAPDYVPGTWSRAWVGIYIRCTPADSPIDIDHADHSVRFRDGIHLYSTRSNDRCIDEDGDAAEPIVDYGPIMVDTKAPTCRVSPTTLFVKRKLTGTVSFALTYSDATSGIASVVPANTASGGAVVNSTGGPDGTTFNVTMPNSTGGRVEATWTITDVAGNVVVCKGTIRAK